MWPFAKTLTTKITNANQVRLIYDQLFECKDMGGIPWTHVLVSTCIVTPFSVFFSICIFITNSVLFQKKNFTTNSVLFSICIFYHKLGNFSTCIIQSSFYWQRGVVDDVAEVSWLCQFGGRESISVCIQDALHAHHVRIGGVVVLSKQFQKCSQSLMVSERYNNTILWTILSLLF